MQQTEDGTKVYGGLEDPEVRFRQRYADLAVHPEVREIFRIRARVISHLRRFLDARGYLEVETPILQSIYGGAAARPFVTQHNALDQQLYLRIADELYLKRLLVGGLERVYEIGHNFRNEGMDRTHNPEFTMVEWYQAYADYHDMMEMLEELVTGLVHEVSGGPTLPGDGVTYDFTGPWRRVHFVDGIREASGVDVMKAAEPEMRAALHKQGVARDEAATWSGGKLLDEMFKTFLEPHLVQPTYVIDYPRVLSPLAQPHRDDPALTERFELFVAATRWRMRSASSTTPTTSAPASRTRCPSGPPVTTRRSLSTRTTCVPWSTACRPPGVSGSGSTAWSWCLPTSPPFAT